MWRNVFRVAPRTFRSLRHVSVRPAAIAPPVQFSSARGVLALKEPFGCAASRALTTTSHIRTGDAETFDFQTETRQVLDIVTHSLYTDREVFLRELVSNASDALEKARHVSLSADGSDVDAAHPLQITVQVDEEKGTVTIQDSGIGMTRSELVSHLGTIARSGTKAFLQSVAATQEADRGNIIGKFGVGFYSAFMVADSVQVFTKSALPESEGLVWTSKGDGKFTIETEDSEEPVDRGTKIVLHLKEDAQEFASEAKIKEIITKYSNFVTFPILMGDHRLNTIQALWARTPREVTFDEHKEFFKFLQGPYGDPHYTLHFVADAPLSIKALFYVPSYNQEKFGFGGRDETTGNISLYSRKVLIQPKSRKLLPEYLRFMTGVVDCEDVPLNISRETAQDSALINKVKEVLTNRVIKFLNSKSASKEKDDKMAYDQFYLEFGTHIKEGICIEQSDDRKSKLAPLFRCESTKEAHTDDEESAGSVSLDDYVDRCPEDQDTVYFICAPSRQAALSSAYMEAFKASDTEVLLLYGPMDEFVMRHLREYRGKKLMNVESAELAMPKPKEDKKEDSADEKKEETDDKAEKEKLSEEDVTKLCDWMFKDVISEMKVEGVRASSRLVESPAMLVGHRSAATMRLHQMQMNMATGHRDTTSGMDMDDMMGPNGTLEINPRHPLIRRLSELQAVDDEQSKEIAQAVAWQIYDNAKIEAGILSNPRAMLARLNTIMDAAVKK